METTDLMLFGLLAVGGYLVIHHTAAAATTPATTDSGLGSAGTISSTLSGLFGGAETPAKSTSSDGVPADIDPPSAGIAAPNYDPSDPSDPYLDPSWGSADSGTSDDNSYLDVNADNS
jgi:hypothetical protein